MKVMSIKVLAMVGILFASLAQAQESESGGETAAAATPPPCSGTQFREFDFWVGDWNVFTVDGVQVGVNSITIEEKGCLLVERWTDANGNTGQSYNFVDHANGKWRQVWVSPGVVIDYTGGLNEAGAMFLEGTVTTQGTRSQRFRGTWSPQEDGSVHQHLRNYDEETGEWAPGFVGIYVRRSTD